MRAQSKALIVGQHHKPVESPDVAGARVRKVNDRAEGCRLSTDDAKKASGCIVQICAQVVMWSEHFPRRTVATKDFQVDFWSSLMLPP